MFDDFRAPTRVETAIASIRNDHRHGASELAIRAAKVFDLARPASGVSKAQYMRTIRQLERELRGLRPAMAPVRNVAANIVGLTVAAAKECRSAEETFGVLVRTAKRVRAERARVPELVASYLHKVAPTIRHPLVISYSSLVVAVLRSWPKGRLHVTVCESRPAYEGRRTATLLNGRAASVSLITDAQAGLAFENCDSVIMGCDTVHASGAVVNKTGSYLIALAAQRAKRPVIVLGDTLKLSNRPLREGEDHPQHEVWRRPPRGVRIRNVSFEIVPADCIDHIVLETGAYPPTAMRDFAERARQGRER
jgi:ribose 1,5-bisphosphate isomerase